MQLFELIADRMFCSSSADPKLWNSLPVHLRQTAINSEWFKWLLKTFLCGCRDRTTLWLTVKFVPFNLSYLL